MSTAASAGVRAGPLLERGAEVLVLAERIEQARAGRGSIVLLEGPPGIGKTTLLTEARALATAAGLRPLAARGSDLERDFAYGVVRQLLEPTLAGEAADALLQGAAAFARPVLRSAPSPSVPPPRDASFTVLHGLYWLCANAPTSRSAGPCCSASTTRSGRTPPRSAS
jgi:hypothetical protein